MNGKTFGTLAAVATVLVIIAFIGQGRNGAESIAGASAGQPLFAGLEEQLDAISGIRITGAGGELLVNLERHDDGWVVAGLGDYPADRSRINTLLIALGEARIVEEKTADPDFHARLGVEDLAAADATGTEVALTTADGDRFAAILGDAYTGGQRYARVSESEQSVLIDRNPAVAEDPSDWADPAIVDIGAARIQRVEISHADGETLVIQKTSADDANFAVDGVPEGRELQYAGVANVTGNVLEGLTLEAVEPAAETPDDPTTTTVFRTFDGLVITADVADAGAEDSWLSFSASVNDADAGTDIAAEAETINERLSGWRYRIPAFKLNQLTRRIEDLLRPSSDE